MVRSSRGEPTGCDLFRVLTNVLRETTGLIRVHNHERRIDWAASHSVGWLTDTEHEQRQTETDWAEAACRVVLAAADDVDTTLADPTPDHPTTGQIEAAWQLTSTGGWTVDTFNKYSSVTTERTTEERTDSAHGTNKENTKSDKGTQTQADTNTYRQAALSEKGGSIGNGGRRPPKRRLPHPDTNPHHAVRTGEMAMMNHSTSVVHAGMISLHSRSHIPEWASQVRLLGCHYKGSENERDHSVKECIPLMTAKVPEVTRWVLQCKAADAVPACGSWTDDNGILHGPFAWDHYSGGEDVAGEELLGASLIHLLTALVLEFPVHNAKGDARTQIGNTPQGRRPLSEYKHAMVPLANKAQVALDDPLFLTSFVRGLSNSNTAPCKLLKTMKEKATIEYEDATWADLLDETDGLPKYEKELEAIVYSRTNGASRVYSDCSGATVGFLGSSPGPDQRGGAVGGYASKACPVEAREKSALEQLKEQVDRQDARLGKVEEKQTVLETKVDSGFAEMMKTMQAGFAQISTQQTQQPQQPSAPPSGERRRNLQPRQRRGRREQ